MNATAHAEKAPALPLAAHKTEYLTRFTVRQRTEHLVAMVLFTLLVVTGMPQKWPSAGISAWIIHAFGGIEIARLVHRVSGILFAIATFAHLALAILEMFLGKAKMTIAPDRKDFTDALLTLKYYLGLSKEQAKFDRYDFRQKFEYWGMVMGGLIMVFSGIVLYIPTWFAWLLPGQIIPAAKMLHSSEGLLATLVIIVWHLYNAHLNPDVFPFDWSIFNGKISRERMEHEHPLELERMEGRAPDRRPPQ
jgi:formate dehydrogenase subunit gamma